MDVYVEMYMEVPRVALLERTIDCANAALSRRAQQRSCVRYFVIRERITGNIGGSGFPL